METGKGTPFRVGAIDGTPLLKATAHEDGGERFVYCEPSNEAIDRQGERVLSRALVEAAPYFLKFGNVDLEHRTIRAAQRQVLPDGTVIPPDTFPRRWEIGRPVEFKDSPKLLVKARIYRGHEAADDFWRSLQIGMPWWPSVGGMTLGKAGTDVYKVLWNNLGLAPYPVNTEVGTVAVVPPEEFLKALMAGPAGTDSAAFTGGPALRRESLAGGVKRRRAVDAGADPDDDDEDEDEDHEADVQRAGGRLLKALRAGSLPADVGAMVSFVERQCEIPPRRAMRVVDDFITRVGRRVRAAHNGGQQ